MHEFLTSRPAWQKLAAEIDDIRTRAATAQTEIERIDEEHQQAIRDAVSKGLPVPAAPNVELWPQSAGYYQAEEREARALQRNLAADVAVEVAGQLQAREAEVLAFVREKLPELEAAAAELESLSDTWNFLAGSLTLRRQNAGQRVPEMRQGPTRVGVVDAVRAAVTGSGVLGEVVEPDPAGLVPLAELKPASIPLSLAMLGR